MGEKSAEPTMILGVGIDNVRLVANRLVKEYIFLKRLCHAGFVAVDLLHGICRDEGDIIVGESHNGSVLVMELFQSPLPVALNPVVEKGQLSKGVKAWAWYFCKRMEEGVVYSTCKEIQNLGRHVNMAFRFKTKVAYRQSSNQNCCS